MSRFYSNINQAVQLSEVENGEKKYWSNDTKNLCDTNGFSQNSYECSELIFNKYLKKYIKTTGIKKCNGEFLCIYFADGSILRMTYYGHDYRYYLNSKALTAQKDGINHFFFALYPAGAQGLRSKYFINKGVEPYISSQWDGTYEGLKRDKAYSKLIQINGWKIPDDYPLKF